MAQSRQGDLSNWYTDHLHHPYATWVALTQGLNIYRVPFQQLQERDDSGYPLEAGGRTWGEMPGLAYPPGVLAVFLPTAWVGRYVPMSMRAFGIINILYLLFLSHVSFFAVLLALKAMAPGARDWVALLSWLMIVSMALEGFFDPLFLGAGALGLRALVRRSPDSALRWFCVAALLHFRVAPLAPFAGIAVWRLLRGKPIQQWPWKTLTFALVSLVLVLGSFLLMYPATEAFRQSHPAVLASRPAELKAVLVLGLIALVVAYQGAGAVVAMSVGVASVLTVLERQPFWWHQGMVLLPVLGVGAVFSEIRRAGWVRTVLMGWVLALGPLVWAGRPVKLSEQPVLFFLRFVEGFRFQLPPFL